MLLACAALALSGCGISETKTVTVRLTELTTPSTTSPSITTTTNPAAKASVPSALSQAQLASPNAIVTAAKKAGEQASSVRMSGVVVDGDDRVALNIMFERGVGCAGTMAVDSINFAVVVVGDTVYAKYPSATLITLLMKKGFSKAEAERLANRVAGRWLQLSAAESKQMIGDFSLDTILSQMAEGFGVLKREPDKTLSGQRAIVLSDTTNGGSLYVAANGAPYPLMVTGGSTSNGNNLVFSNYDARVDIERPANPLVLGSSAGMPIDFQLRAGRRSAA